MPNDETFMRLALREAGQALAARQFPCGCVLTRAGTVLAAGHNRVYADGDLTRHGEMVALARAAAGAGPELAGAVAYVTVEPCLMCAGAFLAAGVARVVYAAPYRGAGHESTETILQQGGFGQALAWRGGVLAPEAAALLAQWQDYKRRVVAEARGLAPAALAELLEREGLTAFHLRTWRGEADLDDG